jgi:hypothetical protein
VFSSSPSFFENCGAKFSIWSQIVKRNSDWFHIVDAGFLNSPQSNSARNQEPSSRGTLNSGLTLADSGLQLDLEIALSGFPVPNACGVETSGDVIEVLLAIRKNDVEFYFTYFKCRELARDAQSRFS